jgi:hypothetical protein
MLYVSGQGGIGTEKRKKKGEGEARYGMKCVNLKTDEESASRRERKKDALGISLTKTDRIHNKRYAKSK